MLFKVCIFGEEILVLRYFLRDSSQPYCKKFHGLKKSGYYYFFIMIF